MPRNATCRSSGGCVANGNVNQDDEEANNNNNNSSSCSGAGGGGDGIVKQELEAAPPVCHRKSERRRVARDIFLVFEEQSTRRRGKGARGKNTRAKQKFGHLKVANTPRISKSVLREIKTEPKCSTAAELSPPEAATPAAAPIPISTLNPHPAPVNPMVQPVPVRTAAVKLETKTGTGTATTTVTASNVVTPRRVTPRPKAPPAEEEEEEEEQQHHHHHHQEVSPAGPLPFSTPTSTPTPNPNPTPSSSAATPSVNPIFLWVKQDDTRIVEVRCEDYDKRNRIRLTKTTNGWRSMPRTDASSTRIVKFFHGSAAPLMKVKREQHHQHQRHEDDEQEEEEQQQQHLEQHEVEQEQEPEQQQPQQMPVIAQSLLQDWEDSVTQLPDEIDDEEDEEEEEATAAEEELQLEAADHTEQPNGHLIENVVLLPSGQEQQTCFDGLLDSEETNASTKATKTNTPTYQSSTPSPLELQLCPKTGLFLPKGDLALIQVPDDDEDAIPVPEEEDKPLATVVHDPAESLDANTKNLKDLLDDADDLLQNCSSDHGSSGADLLDSLVKRSCEDNLVQQDASGSNNPQNTSNTSSSNGPDELSSFCVPDLGKDLPSILNMDNDDDAPKCLSFNEAGEIEGLNGELFLGIEAFEKQQEAVEAEPEPQPPTPATVELTQTPTPTTPTPDKEKEKDKDTASAGGVDETPKDLSYKKREEVCPPSESRSQCAVTSSSDILKSPERDLQLPANSIPAEVETTSETIKNLILEQFLKLNNSNNSNPQQAEPMDLGKAGREGKLETVVIDDEDEEEEESSQPLKKRPKASIKMDKDPDALTQLKMLISNPQWKVPDPILVPKDRLGAVLASPAREIPLLLTTRPELRLPEAFAYPEIIQNPNILVVTMEQLEAILKTEAEQAAKAAKEPDPVIQLVVPSSKPRSPSPKQSQPKPVPPHQPKPAAVAPVAPTPPSPAADSSLSTDLNATTLALLQQMLWLPYFGQLSQEFFKTIKDPLGLQRKFMSNLLPLYNSQFGLQHLDELYKQCMKQKPAEEQQQQQQQQHPKVPTPAPQAPPPPPAAVAHAHAPPSAASGGSTNAFNGFTNPVELAIMQKLLQPQLPQFLNWGEAATKEASSSSSATASSHHHHHQEHKRPRREPETAPPETICNFTKSKPSAAAAAAPAAAVPTPAAPAAAPAPAPTEHKPRLTIKSLSNLLEPEANVVPLLNVPFDGMRGGRSAMHKSLPDQGKEAGIGGRTLRSSKACVTYNPLEQAKQQVQQHSTGVGAQQQQQQRKRGNMLAQDVQLQQQQQQQQQQHLAEAAAAGAAGMDANSALWHPLFGSNPKQGYNSPWQWTTVTATGE